jgi:hypothetical protein
MEHQPAQDGKLKVANDFRVTAIGSDEKISIVITVESKILKKSQSDMNSD